MKLAVINFSGNVGKTTLARHLLVPRIPGAEYIAVESFNAGAEGVTALRGNQFAMLQEYLHSIDSAVVDIGASTVDDFMDLMAQYGGSHEDFDCFIVPTVPDPKQQQDTIATLVDLARLGVSRERLRLVFNTMELGVSVDQAFYLVTAFLREHPLAIANPECRLRRNEIYARVRGGRSDLRTLAQDATDYKRLIGQATSPEDKMALGQTRHPAPGRQCPGRTRPVLCGARSDEPHLPSASETAPSVRCSQTVSVSILLAVRRRHAFGL